MRKFALVSIVAFFIIFILTICWAIFISFTNVKPTTEAINKNLAQFFLRIVYIPEGIPANNGYDAISYFWEMETPAGEVTAVRFNFTPSYTRDQQTIVATLEMPEGGDASIFTKVLPAVISDNQSLFAAQNPQKANLAANDQIGYREIKLTIKPETEQTIKTVWEFDKKTLDNETLRLYSQLDGYPPALVKILFGIPSTVIGLLGG